MHRTRTRTTLPNTRTHVLYRMRVRRTRGEPNQTNVFELTAIRKAGRPLLTFSMTSESKLGLVGSSKKASLAEPLLTQKTCA